MLKQKDKQKELNLLVNTAVQTILLNKDTTKNALNKVIKALQ